SEGNASQCRLSGYTPGGARVLSRITKPDTARPFQAEGRRVILGRQSGAVSESPGVIMIAVKHCVFFKPWPMLIRIKPGTNEFAVQRRLKLAHEPLDVSFAQAITIDPIPDTDRKIELAQGVIVD